MASSGKSEKLGLSLWEASDRPERLDFRQDNEQLEQLLGGHLADASLHLTPEQKNYLQAPYALYTYAGTGLEQAVRFTPCDAKAVLVMCYDAPPVVPRSDGRFDVYWDFWATTTYLKEEKVCGFGGVVRSNSATFLTRSKDSETNSNLVLKMNERGKFYLMILFPALS